jgi:hypothetical protein
MSGAWLCKKVRHPWLGGPRRLTMYLATLDCIAIDLCPERPSPPLQYPANPPFAAALLPARGIGG